MKRDMDLFRSISLELEAKKNVYPNKVEIEGYEQSLISYHVALLKDAGLIDDYEDTTPFGGPLEYWPSRLTNEGHEFLEASRDETIWKKGKSIVIEKGSSAFLLPILKEVLVGLIRQQIGL